MEGETETLQVGRSQSGAGDDRSEDDAAELWARLLLGRLHNRHLLFIAILFRPLAHSCRQMAPHEKKVVTRAVG